MKVLPQWWRREFLRAEFGLAVAVTAGFCIWVERYGGRSVVDYMLEKHRAAVYGALASTFGALLGFVITTVSIVIGFATHDRLEVVRRSTHYDTLWRVFISAIRWLGLATIMAFIGLLGDRENHPSRPLMYAVLLFGLVAILRLARSVWVLERIIAVVTAKPEAGRTNSG